MSVFLARKCLGWLPDAPYLKILYYLKMKRRLNLKNPTSYNEKLQWLKLYYRIPKYTSMVDKVEAKKIAAELIGEQHIIPTLGVWDGNDEIAYKQLPEKFVLKTTNGGGGKGVIICYDKSRLNKEWIRKTLRKAFKRDLYKRYREWPYKNIKKRILAEELLETDDGRALNDYKFYCFDGEPKFMLISSGRFEGKTCFDYFDMEFNPLPFSQGGPKSGIEFKKPEKFEEMADLAKKLSKGIPHVRIDLYEHKGKVYFGEFTFFDSSGFKRFYPAEWDRIIGNWLTLPEEKITD